MMRVFRCKDYRGDFQLEIADDDKMTFGPAIPYPQRGSGRESQRAYAPPITNVPQVYAIRIYASDGKTLKGVVTGVYEILEAGLKKILLVPDVGEFPMPREDDDVPVLARGLEAPRRASPAQAKLFDADAKAEGAEIKWGGI